MQVKLRNFRIHVFFPQNIDIRIYFFFVYFRNTSLTNFSEPLDELTIVGYLEEPELVALFETTGHYYVHQSCVMWSSNSQKIAPELTSRAVVLASSRRCAYCSHYGAGIPCKVSHILSNNSVLNYHTIIIL